MSFHAQRSNPTLNPSSFLFQEHPALSAVNGTDSLLHFITLCYFASL